MKRTIGSLTVILVFVSLAAVWARPASRNIPDLLANQLVHADNNKQLSDIAVPLQRFQDTYQSSIKQAAYDQHLLHKMQQEVRAHMQPNELVPLFFQNVNRLPKAERSSKLKDLQANVFAARTTAASGGITGRVTSDGAPVLEGVTVFAFDSHGYYAGSSELNPETGEYAIANLPSDSFYVVTRSKEYIDEIYNDVASPLGSWDSWQQADKVFVSLAIVDGINFELNRGVPLRVTVAKPDGSPLDEDTFVDFAITAAADSAVVATRSGNITEGAVEVLLPATGQFKIRAAVEGYEPVWYPDQSSWQNAQVINIPDLTARPVLAFQLQTETGVPSGQISGTISPAVLFAVSAAFNAADTSFAGMGLSLISIPTEYFIPDLPAGDYFVYADDYLGSLLGSQNLRGEFYDGADGAYSVEQAKTVSVVAGEETTDISFSLDAGGSIRGQVVDSNGAPVDSLTLVLLNADVLEGGEPFLSRFELHVISTDFNGEYEIAGLPANEYLLRTLSDFYINFDLANPDSILRDGKHKNAVLDQYAGGEANLFNVADADRVVLENEGDTQEVNFTLQAPNFITGNIITSTDDMPVTDVTVVALQDTSGFPFFPFAEIDSVGGYKLGPLPHGQYKVIALTGFSNDPGLLSEYYNNQKSFYDAETVNLSGSMVENVNFALEPGATIEGYVDVPDMSGEAPQVMPVVAFDAETGYVASFDFVQFNGGFRINRLLPGTYKVMTVPPPSDFATTYLGGGMTYEANNTEITVNEGDVSGNHVITMQTAAGHLTGTVTDSATGLPLSGVFVGAYDATGHLVAFDLSDFDVSTGIKVSDTGTYDMRGLPDGNYYVRTAAIFMAVALVDQVTQFVGMFENFDLFSFLFGGALTNLSLDVPIYKDLWYPTEHAGVSIRLDELVYQASAYGLPSEYDNALLPIYAPLPFEEPVPSGAQMVQVSGGSADPVNFVLAPGKLEDVLSGVYSQPEQMPNEYALLQNYPNPFNPSTTISFSLPETKHVDIRIFDTLGRQVKTLTTSEFTSGTHQITWNGRNDSGAEVAAGVYLVQMSAGAFRNNIKIVLVK